MNSIILKSIVILSSALLMVSCERTSFDLAAEVVTVSPPKPVVGEGVTITYRVRNVGKSVVPPGSFKVTLKINGELVAFDYAGNRSPLKPSKSVEYSMARGFFHHKAVAPGVVNYVVEIAPRGLCIDTNAANDKIAGQFEVTDREVK